jgi:hypothetical protein
MASIKHAVGLLMLMVSQWATAGLLSTTVTPLSGNLVRVTLNESSPTLEFVETVMTFNSSLLRLRPTDGVVLTPTPLPAADDRTLAHVIDPLGAGTVGVSLAGGLLLPGEYDNGILFAAFFEILAPNAFPPGGATVTFSCSPIASGSCITGEFQDPGVNGSPVRIVATIDPPDRNDVPVPGTLWLVAAGLGALAMRRKAVMVS